ncbi:hypothetical protein [Nocardia sp. NPDC019302]
MHLQMRCEARQLGRKHEPGSSSPHLRTVQLLLQDRQVNGQAPLDIRRTERHVVEGSRAGSTTAALPVSGDREAERSAAELDVLTEVIGTLVTITGDAVRDGMTEAARANVMAKVIYVLITSARTAAAPHAGRLYAAAVLDPIIEIPPPLTRSPRWIC